jgi:hypothetical protein
MTKRKSLLVEHAKYELQKAGLLDKEDFYGGLTGRAVLDLIKLFSKQRHTGMSASIVRQLFNQLSSYKTITPLTGEDSEWTEVGEGLFQNNRCSNIFRDKNKFKGQAYNLDGKIFSDDGGKSWFTNCKSCVPITFPYNTNIEPKYIKLNNLQIFFRNISFNTIKKILQQKYIKIFDIPSSFLEIQDTFEEIEKQVHEDK